MKITGISIHQPVGLFRLLTDEGLEGWCTGVEAAFSQHCLDQMASVVIDQNPFNRERLWQELLRVDRENYTTLRGYIDIAIWDLMAKSIGIPVYRFINGFRDRVPVYKRGQIGLLPDQVIEEALQVKDEGYLGYKVSMHGRIERVIGLIGDLREAVGPDFHLIFDGRGQFIVADAIKVGRALDKMNFYWFEQPRPMNDTNGGKQVADNIDTPITVEVTTPLEASQVMSIQSADHIRTGMPYSGGFTDVLKIARCTEAFGAFCHLDGPGVCHGFAHLHLLGAVKNAPFFEVTQTFTMSPIIKNPWRIKAGYIHLPECPGLGVDIDWNMVNDQTTQVIKS